MLSGMVGKSSPPSAAKLPATAHGRRTRAAIIDAAAQMMYQKGVAATVSTTSWPPRAPANRSCITTSRTGPN
ncbi:Putative transcriptional regulator, TetR family [Mycobacteroides abscessus subsp. abscessus]|nr:Putative transcriptional regulator, TetR family [Mycobacteroides abscessus subsp. abscessus]